MISTTDAILAGTFLSRAVYGGGSIPSSFRNVTNESFFDPVADPYEYDDAYSTYLAGLATPWNVLTAGNPNSAFNLDPVFFQYSGNVLGSFQPGGLYTGNGSTFLAWTERNKAEAIAATTMINGETTLVLSFRGSDGKDAATGQTFSGNTALSYYDALQPFIKSVLAFALDPVNSVSNIVVAGHSLGGTMADIFSAIGNQDPYRIGAKSFLDGIASAGANISLNVISLASAGLPPDIGLLLGANLSGNVTTNAFDQITAVATPSYYHSINHGEDRVYFAARGIQDDGIGLTWNDPIAGNINFGNSFTINLPNISNTDVDYGGVFFRHGFGAEHNVDLYWANVQELIRDPLFAHYSDQSIVMGISDYSRVPDYDSNSISLFAGYTGLSAYGVDNDQGSRALSGTVGAGAEYILGLTGDDFIRAHDGNDLLSGGDGADTLWGDDGQDQLHGGKGIDELRGGLGSDILLGGRDTDVLYGEQGADTFRIDQADFPLVGQDVIKDYNQGNTGSYSAAEGDIVDVSSFFSGLSGTPAASLVELHWSQFDGKVRLYVDRDGTGPAGWFPVAVFENLPGGAEVAVQVDPTPGATPHILTVPSAPGSWAISPSAQSVDEDGGTISFTITRTDTRLDQTVYISTTQSFGHLNNGDYAPYLDTPVTFLAGQTSMTLTVDIQDDGTAESQEVFGFIVQSVAGQPASQYLAATTFTIRDEDTPSYSPQLTGSNDSIYLAPTSGTYTLHDTGGIDTATLNFSSLTLKLATSTGIGPLRNFYSTSAGLDVSLLDVENLQVLAGSGDDYLFVSSGDNILFGNGGNDSIYGGDGKDGLDGGEGNDQLYGGAGTNVLNGGDGDDFLESAFGAVDAISGGIGIDHLKLNRANLTQGVVFDFVNSGAGASFTLVDGTTVSEVERIEVTTGSGNDHVTFAPSLNGWVTWNAGGGTDTVTLDFSSFSQDLFTDLFTGAYQTSTGGPVVSLANIENLEVVGGSGNDAFDALDGDDLLIGKGGDDTLSGGFGNDGIDGGVGNDYLFGGFGVNVLNGSDGDDYLISSDLAVDAIYGGSGIDMLELNRGSIGQSISFAFDGSGAGASFALVDGTTVSGVEHLANLVTGSGDDHVSFVMSVSGWTLWDAQEGNDIAKLDFSGSTQDVSGWSGGSFFTATEDRGVSLGNVETVEIIGGAGNDYFEALDGNDILKGNGGNDQLRGGAGTNLLDGGSGDDFIVSSGLGDTIIGSTGVDTVALSGLSSEYVFSGTLNAFNATETANPANVINLSGVEFLQFSNGIFSAASLGIQNVNSAPTVTGPINLGGLAEDSTQLITANQLLAGALDVDGDTLSVVGLNASSGTLVDNSNGTWSFTPAANDDTDVTFSFGVSDGQATTPQTATLDLTPVNDAPVGVGDAVTATKDQVLTLSAAALLVNDSDIDTAAAGLSVGAVQNGTNGTVILNANGTVSFTPAAGFTGTATFFYQPYDGTDLGAPTLVTVNVYGAGMTLIGTSAADTLTGGAGDDTIAGAAGNDLIDGSAGRDVLTGGTGNDTIFGGADDDTIRYGTGSNGFDALDGGAGSNDRLVATAAGVTIGLASLAGIEAVDAAGFANVKILGSSGANSFDFSGVTLTGIASIHAGAGNDTVIGSAAADVIIAGSGNDVLRGGGGDDLFKVSTSAGIDTYDGGSGLDTIQASANNVTLTVTGTNLTSIETISAGAFTGFKLIGTSANNTLDFSGVNLSGVARIGGGNGNDVITGSVGADVIEGGAGRDTLTGGLGADVFDFNLTSHSKGSANIDRITDFVQGTDLVDLSSIDANTVLTGNDAFIFISNAAFGGVAGELRYDTTSIAGVTRILADTDGNRTVDFEIHLTGSYNLAAGDFLL